LARCIRRQAGDNPPALARDVRTGGLVKADVFRSAHGVTAAGVVVHFVVSDAAAL
jgi:hypothetical protein